MTRALPIHQRRRKSNVATSYYAAAVAALVLVATTVLGAVEARSSEHHEQWALLAAGNRDYSNYRFQSDVAHAYQRIISGGVPEEHIVSLSYDDVPGSERNPYKWGTDILTVDSRSWLSTVQVFPTVLLVNHMMQTFDVS